MNPASFANSKTYSIVNPAWLANSIIQRTIKFDKSGVTKNVNPFITAKSLVLASATGNLDSDIFGDYGGGNEIKGRDIADDYWSRLYSLLGVYAAINNKETTQQQQEWDSHGLPTNIIVEVNELASDKKYMIYDIMFVDKKSGETLSNHHTGFCPGGIYNKAEFQKKLECLQNMYIFERVELELKTNFDGTISIKILFQEFSHRYYLKFRCISVGLLPKLKENYTELEYKRRIERSMPCLLPDTVQREIVNMLKKHEKLCVKPLLEIPAKVNKWYKDNGYARAQVVRLGNLHTKELVCEVIEGNITRMDFLFQDKNGNVIDWDTKLPLVKKNLPKQFCEGQIFKMEHAHQALENLFSSGFYSEAIMNTLQDDENKAGTIVQFVLTIKLWTKIRYSK